MKKFEKIERKGLPGGPNEQFTYITGVFSTEGYKSDSPDVNNPFNIIDSGNITMEGVDFPVMGTDNLGNSQMMMPGMNYQFPGDQVFEIPMAQRGQESGSRMVKYPAFLDEAVDGVSGAAMQMDKSIVDIARRWANSKVDGRRPALSVIDRLRSIFAGEDSCVNDNTCVQVVKEIVNEASFNAKGLPIEGAPYIPDDIYNNRAFRENHEDYGFVEITPEDGGERFREDELQPGDIIQYYYNEDSPDVKEGDGYIGFPYHLGVYDKLDQYISDGDTFFPVMRNNMFTNEEGVRKDPFYVYRPKNMRTAYKVNNKQKGGSVSWQWKGKTYSGTLIPSMETETNRYARTENGKIKTLPKKQDGGEEEKSLWGLVKEMAKIPGANISNLLDIAGIPANLVAEGVEAITGRGDGEFNFMDAMPNLAVPGSDDELFTFTNTKGEPVKDVAGLKDEEGKPLVDNIIGALALNLATDPSAYVGAGALKNVLGIGAKNAPKVIKSAAPKVIKKASDDVIKSTDDAVEMVEDIFGNQIKKTDAERFYRIEDANVRSDSYMNPVTRRRIYEDGNWVSNDPNAVAFYTNNTATAGFPRQAGNYLPQNRPRRLISGYMDKNTSSLFNAPNSTARARNLSGGAGNSPLNSEFIIPPHLMDNLRMNAPADMYRNDIFKAITDLYKSLGGDIPKNQLGGLKTLAKELLKKSDDIIPKIQSYFRNIYKGTDDFVSEIDWSKWNEAIPQNKVLLQEYNLIEETTKANKTWMKNADGSAFKGTPEQFIQSKSGNFQKAFPQGYQSVYRGVPGEDIEKFGPLGVNTKRTDIGTGVFTADENVAKNYNFSAGSSRRDGHTLNLAMRNSDNSLIFDALGNFHGDLNFIGTSKEMLKKNLDIFRKRFKEQINRGYDMTVDRNSASNLPAKLESYENFYKNYDEIVSNPVYQKLVKYKKDLLNSRKGTKKPGFNNFSTDDLAGFLEREGLDNIQLRYVEDGSMGTTNIHNQVPGNYLKSLVGNDGTFDLTNPNIYKQQGGEYNPYMDIDSESQKRRDELLGAIDRVVKTQGGDPNLKALLIMTAAMENSLGADSSAYGRDYTRGPMSIDDIAFKTNFEIGKGANDYSKVQKKYFDWFDSLGFDLENMDDYQRNNILANVAGARMQYGLVDDPLPKADDPEAMYKYYMDFYNRTKADHKDRFMKNYNAFIKGKQKGGEIAHKVYKKFMQGGFTGSEEKEAEKIFDKLNRVHYKDAKKLGMTPTNYIMTFVIPNS